MKSVINDVLASKIEIDHFGKWELLIDKRYACTELFAIIFEAMKLIGGGTCRKTRIDLPGNYERLKFKKCAERGTYRLIYNR